MPAGEPRLFAVVGDPVAHSLSPVMHNAAIAALGLDAMYVAARTTAQALPALVHEMLAASGALNVTAPFKFLAAGLLDEPTDEVRLTGVCNTIWGERGRVHGDNTDIEGIRTACRALVPGGLRHATILGSGASARSTAIAVAREWPGVEVHVRARTQEKEGAFVAWARAAGVRCERAGPAGLVVEAIPRDAAFTLERDDRLHEGWFGLPEAMLDLNYRPARPLSGGDRLFPFADGRGVLVAQGAASFERFFGVPAPVDVMRQAVEDALRA